MQVICRASVKISAMKIFLHALFLLFAGLITSPAFSVSLPGLPEFIDEMVKKHQFDRDELTLLFERVNEKPQIIEAISRPATIKPWLEYRAAFVNQNRIAPGLLFWNKYHKTLRRAERQYGVPQEIIVALLGVETIYGRNMGNFRTLDALTTLAFDYPRRADFFRDELENYLLLAREQEFDLLDVKSSYAGAMGIPQFMPSSYRKYAVDFNGDQKTDLFNEPVDAIGSVANYLKAYGWIRGEPVAVRARVGAECCTDESRSARSLAEWADAGILPEAPVRYESSARLLDYTVTDGREYWLGFNNFDVITRYNNSDFYAMSVFQLAEALKEARRAKH